MIGYNIYNIYVDGVLVTSIEDIHYHVYYIVKSTDDDIFEGGHIFTALDVVYYVSRRNPLKWEDVENIIGYDNALEFEFHKVAEF